MLRTLFKRFRRSPKDGAVIALDVGTTGAKALIFDKHEQVIGKAYQRLETHSFAPGQAEQDPAAIILAAQSVMRDALASSRLSADDISGTGFTNQRETTVAWQRSTGEALFPAIEWADTRTASQCAALRQKTDNTVPELTGLPVEAYFSASKIRWLLDNVPAVKTALDNHDLAVGTVDSWLIWNLLEASPHLTDQTNASRTLLYNIHTSQWDSELLDIFNLPAEILPAVRPSRGLFGTLKRSVFGANVPVLAVCGDQQASMFAAGTAAGTTKITYGTGTFIMQSLGPDFSLRHPFYTTLIPDGGEVNYALEAKIPRGGQEVEPLLKQPLELEQFLRQLAVDVDHYLDQLPIKPTELIIDGGVARDEYIPRLQREVSNIPVRRQPLYDGTALGLSRLIRAKKPSF